MEKPPAIVKEEGSIMGKVDLRLRAHPDEVSILPGAPSDVWRYTAQPLAGPEGTLTPVGESYAGPLIRLRRGQRLRVRIDNGLPEDTTMHWHGLHVPSEVDGQPRLPIAPATSTTVAFDVVARENDSTTLPERLALDLPASPVQADTPVRRFELGMRMMQGFTMNGRRMEGATVADDEVVRLGQTEVWEFINNTMMPHPIHVHGLQFLVHERIPAGGKTDLHNGIIDAGLHDTVLVFPEERVRIALTFENFEGLYMYHCHNMEHEDTGMMRYFRVVAWRTDGISITRYFDYLATGWRY